MRVKKLPMILALHLKRFKYMDQLHRYTKLSYRVVFPLELRLFNTSGDATNPDRMYDLVAVVVHCGRWDIHTPVFYTMWYLWAEPMSCLEQNVFLLLPAVPTEVIISPSSRVTASGSCLMTT